MHNCPGHSNNHFSRDFKFFDNDIFACFNVCFNESRIAASRSSHKIYFKSVFYILKSIYLPIELSQISAGPSHRTG